MICFISSEAADSRVTLACAPTVTRRFVFHPMTSWVWLNNSRHTALAFVQLCSSVLAHPSCPSTSRFQNWLRYRRTESPAPPTATPLSSASCSLTRGNERARTSRISATRSSPRSGTKHSHAYTDISSTAKHSNSRERQTASSVSCALEAGISSVHARHRC